MQQALSVLKWMMRGLLILACAAAAVTFYYVYTQPGVVAGKLLGVRAALALPEGARVADPSAPAQGAAPVQASPRQMPTVVQGGYMGSPAQLSGDGPGKEKAPEAAAEAQPYSPPVAQRKTVRVGE